jgi:hypothetical protein
MNLQEFLKSREIDLLEEISVIYAQIKTLQETLPLLENELAAIRRARAAAGIPNVESEGAFGDLSTLSPYDHLTMKELVVKALNEHFVHGATTKQLIQFFRDAWSRIIERTNLSPQLSRLYQEGTIGRASGRKEWHLMQRSGIIVGYVPVIVLRTGEVNWMEPGQIRSDEHLLITQQGE